MRYIILAYLDPGTGSFILQMLIAFIVGASFFIKGFWRKIKFYILNFFPRK